MTSSAADPCLGDLLSLEEALSKILASLSPLCATEVLPLKQAKGRILAEPIQASQDLPAFANSAVDGYALNLKDQSSRLRVVGESFAGKPYLSPLSPGQAVRIFTGAATPPGTSAVIMQEEVVCKGEEIYLKRLPAPGENLRPAGSDVAAGEIVLTSGQRLKAADLGLLAALGRQEVRVIQKLRVAYFSTGDELRSLDEALGPGQIYDSNRYSLSGLLEEFPVSACDLGSVPDEVEAICALLAEAGRHYDLILSSGGASVGEADLLREALTRVGQLNLWQIAIKPGKPLLFGRVGRAWYFGLPGNPVSVHVGFSQIVRPALWKLAGLRGFKPLRLKAVCQNDLVKTPGRLEFMRGKLGFDASGQLTVTGLARQGSHQLAALSQADCFLLLPAASRGVRAGELVEVEPFSLEIDRA
jgi:molybdopterin molybdotransferase